MKGIEELDIQSLDGNDEHRFQYNGKEKIMDFGLNWTDYGWRNMDTQLGRWHGVDNLAEKYQSISSYTYVANNPIKFIDPDGQRIDDYYGFNDNDELVYLGSDGQGNAQRFVNENKTAQAQKLLEGEVTDEDRTALRSDEGGRWMSKEITFNESNIASKLQDAHDNTTTTGLEHSVIITIDPNTAIVDAITGATGSNTEVTNSFDVYGGALSWKEGQAVLGVAHTHPITQTAGKVNASGYSANDANTASQTYMSSFAIDSYGVASGEAAVIHEVNAGNASGTNPIGTTQNTNNLGKKVFLQVIQNLNSN